MTPKRTRGQPSHGPRTALTVRLPDNLADALRTRAAAHNRAVNAELVAILSAVLSGTPAQIATLYLSKHGIPVRDLEQLAR